MNNEDKSDMENWMDNNPIDLSDEDAEWESIIVDREEPVEYVEDKTELTTFADKLEEARNLLKSKGKNAGLCPHCLGTGVAITETVDGYQGLQYKIDNEMPIKIKCNHGELRDRDSFDF